MHNAACRPSWDEIHNLADAMGRHGFAHAASALDLAPKLGATLLPWRSPRSRTSRMRCRRWGGGSGLTKRRKLGWRCCEA